jgi:transcriptional regulator with XRE-family HTH domain
MQINLEVHIAQELKRRRLELGLTQADVALRAGVTSRYVRKIESAQACPTLNVFVKFAIALEADPVELLKLLLRSPL